MCKRGGEVKWLSRVWLFATPWTVAYYAPLSTGLSRQEYWSGLPFPSPGDLPNPGIEPGSPALQADALPPEPPGKPRERWRHGIIKTHTPGQTVHKCGIITTADLLPKKWGIWPHIGVPAWGSRTRKRSFQNVGLGRSARLPFRRARSHKA